MTDTPSLEQLKSTLQNLVFIHSKLTATAFYPEEFEAAGVSIRMIVEMAEKVHKDVQALEPQPQDSTDEQA